MVGDLLRSLVNGKPRRWEEMLATAEFAYPNSVNRSTERSPFVCMEDQRNERVGSARNKIRGKLLGYQ